jgi:hypothetical protein
MFPQLNDTELLALIERLDRKPEGALLAAAKAEAERRGLTF